VWLGLSARAHTRILKVARTIADMEGAPALRSSHVAEADGFRQLIDQSSQGEDRMGAAGGRIGFNADVVDSLQVLDRIDFAGQ
jgi:hypothetical protein